MKLENWKTKCLRSFKWASLFIAIGSWLAVVPIWADSPVTPGRGIARCVEGPSHWDIVLAAPSQKPKEVDVTEATQVLIGSGNHQVPVVFDIDQETWIDFEPGPSNIPSLCDKTAAYALPDHRVVIFLALANPPFGVRLSLAIYDPIHNKVLGGRSDLGEYRSPVQAIISGATIWFKTEETPSDSVQCPENSEEKCPAVKGVETKSISDSTLPIWRRINLDDPPLHDTVDRKMTWQKSPIYSFFANQNAFEGAFRYDPVKDHYEKVWYRLAELADGRRCLYPTTNNRNLPASQDQWLCRASQQRSKAE